MDTQSPRLLMVDRSLVYLIHILKHILKNRDNIKLNLNKCASLTSILGNYLQHFAVMLILFPLTLQNKRLCHEQMLPSLFFMKKSHVNRFQRVKSTRIQAKKEL